MTDTSRDQLFEVEAEQGDMHPLLSASSPFKTVDAANYGQLETSTNSVFSDDVWKYFYDDRETKLTFQHGEWNGFFKQVMFCLLPSSYYTKTINSLRSSRTNYGSVEVFVRTMIDLFAISPDELRLLSAEQISAGLAHAKDSEQRSFAWRYARGLSHWLALCEGGLLSDSYTSPLKTSQFSDRIREVYRETEFIAWEPIDIETLTDLWKETQVWLNDRGDDIVEMFRIWGRGEERERSSHSVRVGSAKGKRFSQYQASLEGGSPWYTPIIQISSSGDRHRDYYLVSDVTRSFPYKLETYACFVLLLFSGMRAAEAVALELGCCVKTPASDGEYSLTFKRFKTAGSPEIGEQDIIPVPAIVHRSISLLESLAEIKGHKKYLFENVDSCLKRTSAYIYNRVSTLGVHPHMCRKTIAWLLISRDEENIELVRELLGHKSYAMTLHYLSRNPELIESAKEIFRMQYTAEFKKVVASVQSGRFSGGAAERIASQLSKAEGGYAAETVDLAIEEYIRVTLESGSPLFLKRIPVGGYCIVQRGLSGTPTPCTAGMPATEIVNPVISNCRFEECPNAVLTEAALPNIEKNIAFYERLLASTNIKSVKVRDAYMKKLSLNEKHRDNLVIKRDVGVPLERS